MTTYPLPAHYTVFSQTDALLDRLGSAAFDAEVHLASGLRLAVKIADAHPAVRALVAHLRDQPTEGVRVLSRIELLSHDAIDAQWASPHEATLLGLLVAVRDALPEQLPYAASHARSASNAPWVQRLADELVATHRRVPSFHVSGQVAAPARVANTTDLPLPPPQWRAAGFVAQPSPRSTKGGA